MTMVNGTHFGQVNCPQEVSLAIKSGHTPLVGALRSGLGQCVEPGENGQPVLRISLPDANTLEGLAQTLARLMVPAAPAEQASDTLP